MSQLEENLAFRLGQLEKTLQAYRVLHVIELDEIARSLQELRQEVEALANGFRPPPERKVLNKPGERRSAPGPLNQARCGWTSDDDPTC